MDHIDLTGWEIPDGIAPQDCVSVVRGQGRFIERLVVEVPGERFDVSDIRIGGVAIAFGGQIAECIYGQACRRGRRPAHDEQSDARPATG